MTGHRETRTAAPVRLEGGPSDFPEELRVSLATIDAHKVKIPHRGGYEHFERTDERYVEHNVERVVFRWVTRTRIAE